MNDEILEEVRRAREAFAKRHNYDLDSMVAELQDLERKSKSTRKRTPKNAKHPQK